MKDAILSGKVHMEVSSQDDPFTRKNARMKVLFYFSYLRAAVIPACNCLLLTTNCSPFPERTDLVLI